MLDSDSPYTRLGGAETICAIVNRFYDLVETDPLYAALMAMHHGDLGPVRESLAQFLIAWSGGPRDWFTNRPGLCIMGLHRDLKVTAETAAQWAHAMARAIAAEPMIDPELARAMTNALDRMCRRMVAQACAREMAAET